MRGSFKGGRRRSTLLGLQGHSWSLVKSLAALAVVCFLCLLVLSFLSRDSLPSQADRSPSVWRGDIDSTRTITRREVFSESREASDPSTGHTFSSGPLKISFQYRVAEGSRIYGDYEEDFHGISYSTMEMESIGAPLFTLEESMSAYGHPAVHHSRDWIAWGDSSDPQYSPIQGHLLFPVEHYPYLQVSGVFDVSWPTERETGELSLIDWSLVQYFSAKEDALVLDFGSFWIGSSFGTRVPRGQVVRGKASIEAIAQNFTDGHIALWLRHTYANETTGTGGLVKIADLVVFQFATTMDELLAQKSSSSATNHFKGLSSSASVPVCESIPFVIKAKGKKDKLAVVTSLMSEQELPLLRHMCMSWPGLISAALLTSTPINEKALHSLRSCSNLHLHVVSGPSAHSPISASKWGAQSACSANFLKNVAMSNCDCGMVLYLDVGLVPSQALTVSYLKSFARTNEVLSKSAFVVPSFEVSTGKTIPTTIDALYQSLRTKEARPFSHLAFSEKQDPTDFARWRSVKEAYDVAYDFFYEPYVIVPVEKSPRFQTDVPSTVLDQALYIYQLFASGYGFSVLPGVFVAREHSMREFILPTEMVDGLRAWNTLLVQMDRSYGVFGQVSNAHTPAHVKAFQDRSFFSSIGPPALGFIHPNISSAADVDKGLVVWLRFDDELNLGLDVKSRGMATLSGAVLPIKAKLDANGPAREGAVYLEGLRAGVRLGKNGIWLGPSWSICAWTFVPLPTTSNTHSLACSLYQDAHIVASADARQELGTTCATTGEFMSSGVKLGKLRKGWHHICGIGHGGRTVFYIDGAARGSVEAQSLSDVVFIGNTERGGQRWGALDDVRLYDRALTSSEVRSIYRHRVRKDTPTPVPKRARPKSKAGAAQKGLLSMES